MNGTRKMSEQKSFEENFLLNQSKELLTFRERNTNNIISSSNAYSTFLGLAATALALFIDFQEPTSQGERINLIEQIIMIFAGIAILLYGCFIYRHIWSFFINQTIYTRKLNMTRAYLSKEKISPFRVLLPTSSESPGFDDLGHLGEKFSENGVVSWIRIANSLVVFLLVIGFITLINRIAFLGGLLKTLVLIISIILAIAGFFTSYALHDKFDRSRIIKAEEYWNVSFKKWKWEKTT
jgi:hypothetical protein